jgi:hypothetical protein
MTVFMTKTWGFSIPCSPLLQFSLEGFRARARAELKPGDLVVIVGTKNLPTQPAEQGRLLGIMEPTTEVVSWQDFDLPTRPEDFDDEGEYRWPHGLLNRAAWRILDSDRHLLEEVSSREFHMDSALGIVPLNDEEAANVIRLAREPVERLLPVRARARIEGEESARRRAAPPPTTTRQGIMHLRGAPAYTYLMAIEGAQGIAFKIGWAFEYNARQRQFNQFALPEIGGLRYRTRLHRLWDTARQAFGMEQAILRQFGDDRHRANREVIHGISYQTLEAAWIDYLSGAPIKGRSAT